MRCRLKSEAAAKSVRAEGGRALRARVAMDMWTMHLRRPWTTRRFAAALPTAAAFDHMPTAVDH